MGAQPSRQKSQSTRPGAYSALLSFLNITSGDFAGNCLTHPKHLKSPMHCARLTRVPCTMAAGSGTGWAGIEGSHRGLTASAQVGETPVRPPPGAPNRRSPGVVRYNPSQRTQQRPWGAIFSRLGRPHDERGASAHYVRIYSYDVRRGGKAYGLPCGSGLSVQ